MHGKLIKISQGSLGSLHVAVPTPSLKMGGGEGTATRRVQLHVGYGYAWNQSFFINATSKLVTKLQAIWLIDATFQ